MKSKMTTKHKAMAYILNKDMGYTMNSISDLMKVSQSTISKGIKDFELEMTIKNLTNQLEQAKNELYILGYRQDPREIIPPMFKSVNQQNIYIETGYTELD